MNSNYIVCCSKCLDNLMTKDKKIAELWVDLCQLTLLTGPIVFIHYPDIPQLRVLEKEGYILSFEDEECLKIKVKGILETENEEYFFCPKECQDE